MKRISKISAIVLTKNEEAGLGNTLENLKDFEDVIVVDSLSEDRTLEIAVNHGARVVHFEWNSEYPKKKQWSLENANPLNEWILLLDADEFPTASLINELVDLQYSIESSSHGAFDINLLYRFAGRYLRHGHVVTKRSLLHIDRASFPVINDLDAPGIREVEGHYQPETAFKIGKLRNRLIHDDRDPVSSWFARHNRYSDWEAHLRLNQRLRKEIASKRTFKGRMFDMLPLKPILFFGYAFILRGGFLDGRAGMDYALALSAYYWQIGVKYRELVGLAESEI
ncbi:glycosyltransferase family 2 protein [Nesterenkonia muleiensis]|uniref:glycosyltransferase family 2 protein n=1 Tax=Nesterenkonia muleiensis TaxID=2282648 RepID=UPI001EE4C7E5|nr:glycosyltransferase family 2 protein [Nesterenkonia muleiensis]